MGSEKKKVVEIKIKRFDPEGKRGYFSTYKVPILAGMTLLDALLYIKENLDGRGK